VSAGRPLRLLEFRFEELEDLRIGHVVHLYHLQARRFARRCGYLLPTEECLLEAASHGSNLGVSEDDCGRQPAPHYSEAPPGRVAWSSYLRQTDQEDLGL
jgi:hypothetical protein